MRNIKLVIEYDGTNYAGWQRQNDVATIQGKVESAISKITSELVQINGCSRTDAGVHAKGYIANFYTSSRLEAKKFKAAINSKLPKDIIILDSSEVEEAFHARYNSKGKTYSYTILNRYEAVAIGKDYVYHYRFPLNIDKMKKGAEFLVGTHDFSTFKTMGSSVKTSVRTVTELNVTKDGELIKIYASADGFLYNMVRIMVGTLIDVGIGKTEPETVREILLAKDRSRARVCVPAQGLCLEKVYY
jgi:tRNA pseudouridine38-40 synthase